MIRNLEIKQRNKNGFIGFSLAILSMFIYDLLIFQLLAIFFSYKGIVNARLNQQMSKWQAQSGIVIGCIYLLLWIYNFAF